MSFNRAVTTKINETRRIYLDNTVPYGRHGMAECRLHSKIPGDIRETYRFKFDWLGGGPSSAAYVENLGDMNHTDRSIAGRVTVADLGTGGYIGINVVGVSTGGMNWTLFCDLYIEP